MLFWRKDSVHISRKIFWPSLPQFDRFSQKEWANFWRVVNYFDSSVKKNAKAATFDGTRQKKPTHFCKMLNHFSEFGRQICFSINSLLSPPSLLSMNSHLNQDLQIHLPHLHLAQPNSDLLLGLEFAPCNQNTGSTVNLKKFWPWIGDLVGARSSATAPATVAVGRMVWRGGRGGRCMGRFWRSR